MAEVTEADREKAAQVLRADNPITRGASPVEAVAAALAEEREKARAPFLALADAMERAGETDVTPSGDAAYFWARAIRNRAREAK
jgi:hypothetical protein